MKISINRESPIPLHEQLLNQIRHLIMSGEWGADQRLPSEAALTRGLQISRGTIRQALKNAELEGLVRRVASKGTFVARRPARNGLSRLIGYITSDFMSDFQQQLLKGAEEQARSQGYRILFSTSSHDLELEDRLLERMLADQVSGLLVWPIHDETPARNLRWLAERCDPPMVLMDRTVPGLKCDCVASDNYAGAYEATRHLIQLGHRRIVFLSRPLLKLSPIASRLQGHYDALRDAGLQPLVPWLIDASDPDKWERYTVRLYSSSVTIPEAEAIARRLKERDRPTAILAMNDLTALLVLQAAAWVGLRVPLYLSVVGFDDVQFASLLPTPLTTVRQNTLAMGQRAAELLIERIEGYQGPARYERIPTKLQVRATTARPGEHGF